LALIIESFQLYAHFPTRMFSD